MQITVVPIGTQKPSVGEYIADIEQFLQARGVEHSLHDMGTIISGTTGELLELVAEIHRLPFTKGAERVITNIILDERLDMDRKLGEKQQSVIQRLQEKSEVS